MSWLYFVYFFIIVLGLYLVIDDVYANGISNLYDELYEIDKVCVTGACYRENIDALLMKHGGGLTFTYSDELDVGWSVGEKGDLPLQNTD